MRVNEFSLFLSAWLAGLAASRPFGTTHTRRDLLGLLGDVDGAYPTTAAPDGPTSTLLAQLATTPSVSSAQTSEDALSTAATAATSPAPTRTASRTAALTDPAPTAAPKTGTGTGTAAGAVPPASTAASPSPGPPYGVGAAAEAPATPPGELAEWKVIGVAVITITGIALAVLAVSFFDAWWGFVCAAVCGRRRRGARMLAGETLVPDWEKRSWEFRLASEDGHRYPTMASLESIVREKERAQKDGKTPEVGYGGAVL